MTHSPTPGSSTDGLTAPRIRIGRPTLVAEGLAFPEGPALLPDGRVAFVEMLAGRIMASDGRAPELVARTGGRPNGLALAAGHLFVARGPSLKGPIPGPVEPAIVALELSSGHLDVVATHADGLALRAPNDLFIDRNRAIVFTDPGPTADGLAAGGWLCVVDDDGCRREAVLERTYPNGILVDADGRWLWTESTSDRVMAADRGRHRVVVRLPMGTIPDGCALMPDNDTLLIAAFGARAIIVVSIALERVIQTTSWTGLARPTNLLVVRNELWVTDAGPANQNDAGRLWRMNLHIGGGGQGDMRSATKRFPSSTQRSSSRGAREISLGQIGRIVAHWSL